MTQGFKLANPQRKGFAFVFGINTLLMLILFSGGYPLSAAHQEPTPIQAETAARFVELALDCVHREYPNKIAHVLSADEDALPPRSLHPAFFGCFDWHSAVHGHWLLVRLLRLFPEAPWAARVTQALDSSFTEEKIRGESAYFEGEDRASYERPYGLAWLLQLAQELKEWETPKAQAWYRVVLPLETVVADRFRSWLPKLAYPIRTGEHSQTAFAFGLALDWARARNDRELADLLEQKSREFYGEDRDCPLAYEPSGQDFLSPCLAEADLMRRCLDQPTFAVWLARFLPQIPLDGGTAWLPLGVVTDPSDGKLAHLDGLNLSRAWMLEGIAAALPPRDPRLPSLRATAQVHTTSGLAAVTGAHYAGGHWLGSFAAYLVTRRGVAE